MFNSFVASASLSRSVVQETSGGKTQVLCISVYHCIFCQSLCVCLSVIVSLLCLYHRTMLHAVQSLFTLCVVIEESLYIDASDCSDWFHQIELLFYWVSLKWNILLSVLCCYAVGDWSSVLCITARSVAGYWSSKCVVLLRCRWLV